MHSLGFEPINKEKTAFSNGEIIASDLQKSNILKDINGNIRVIDADMKLHTKDVGGKYSYTPVEKELMKDSKGTVYGWTDGETIYLNKETMNPNTPIHEYTHLWAKALQKQDPKAWNEIKGMLKETPIWDEVLNDKDYSDIHDDEDRVASEVLSRISGKDNAAKLETEAQKRIDEANGVFEKAEAVSMRERIKDAVKKFWKWISEKLFGRKFKSVEDVTDLVLKDLLKGVKPESEKGRKDFMFIGKKGASNKDKMNEATGMLDGLKAARDMETARKDAKSIKLATGWEKGKDGKWRYEITDFDDFNVQGNAEWLRKHPQMTRYNELGKKKAAAAFGMGKELTEAEIKEYEELQKQYKDYDMSRTLKSVIVEVNENKENVEVVNWHYIKDDTLKKKRKQAAREGGLILTLSKDNAAANTSKDLLSIVKDKVSSEEKQIKEDKDAKNNTRYSLKDEQLDIIQ